MTDDLSQRLRDRYPDDPDVQALIGRVAADDAVFALQRRMAESEPQPYGHTETRQVTARRPLQAGQMVTSDDVE